VDKQKKEINYLDAHVHTILLRYFFIGQYLLIWTSLSGKEVVGAAVNESILASFQK
jgi:hypothetical protein